MGKSKAKAKINRRLRSSRREYMDKTVTLKKIDKLYQKILLSNKGFEYREPIKGNAFLYPDDPNAQFPQFVPDKPIDFRSSKNPFSGTENPGGKRKKRPRNLIHVKIAGEVAEEVLEMEKKTKQGSNLDNKETSEDLINTLINMKILDDTIKVKGRKTARRIGKRNNKRNLKKTKRAMKF